MYITDAINAQYLLKKYGASSGSNVGRKTFADAKNRLEQESVVEEYKRKHPQDARHVEEQVKAGRAIRRKNGVDGVATEEMSMDEYKAYFHALLDTVPYDPTRVNDQMMLTITDAGWEQMKKDPDYEAWILGYFVEDRSVRNPFYGWGGNGGMFSIEHFGASIEEHHGQGFMKAAPGSKTDEDEESWWTKRHKRSKKLMKEQLERAQKRDTLKKAAVQEAYLRQQYESAQKLYHFLTADVQTSPMKTMPERPDVSMAMTAYNGILDLFGSPGEKGADA